MSEITDIINSLAPILIGIIPGILALHKTKQNSKKIKASSTDIDSAKKDITNCKEDVKKVGQIATFAAQKTSVQQETIKHAAEAIYEIHSTNPREKEIIEKQIKLDWLSRETEITKKALERLRNPIPSELQADAIVDLPR